MMLSRRSSNSEDVSPIKKPNSSHNDNDTSDDDGVPIQRNRKLVQRFSDSDTEKENDQSGSNKIVENERLQNNSDSESECSYVPVKSGLVKSRIRMDDSSSESEGSRQESSVKNIEQLLRMKNKRNKLKDKFKSLLNSREKTSLATSDSDKETEERQESLDEESDSEMSSIAKIKQKIKKSMASVSSICDPDTSDEESSTVHKKTPKPRQRKEPKSTKLTEPKPVRMSAKQAMENMQLIKSESNRMLREKAVSLPYHRPKALSLKDIMARRKPAVSSDGKVLPIKMNEEQLKQYAKQLEERQKEMMELCKSESDEETADNDDSCKDSEQPDENSNNENKTSDKAPENMRVDNNTQITNESDEIIQNDLEKTVGTTKQKVGSSEDIVDANGGRDAAETSIINDNEFDSMIQSQEPTKLKSEQDSQLISLHFTEKNTEESATTEKVTESNDKLDESDKNDSNSDMKLVYNDSVEECGPMDTEEGLNNEDVQKENIENDNSNKNSEDNNSDQEPKTSSETDYQPTNITTEMTENNTDDLEKIEGNENLVENTEEHNVSEENQGHLFSDDDDVNMDDIDKIIENAEIIKDDEVNSPMLINDSKITKVKPRLTGAPGMVIDLEEDKVMQARLSGVELLKERFIYFSKLKTPEELEREKEKKIKPGTLHLKLKQELGEQIAEQRSLEWAKRLEEEKQQHKEMESILDDDAEDSFEKLEKELDEKPDKDGLEEVEEQDSGGSESEDEEELEENDIEIKDKPRKYNPMVDDEAEESECDEENDADNEPVEEGAEIEEDLEQNEEDEESSEEEESSESEVEESSKPKKGRILKAFEDSDDEDCTNKHVPDSATIVIDREIKTVVSEEPMTKVDAEADGDGIVCSADFAVGSQDDVIQLAQRAQSTSDDLFTSQESEKIKDGAPSTDEVLGTQTFSILESTAGVNMDIKSPSKISSFEESQPYIEPNLNAEVGISQLPITQTSQSQTIGEDILALCTGKFYDNVFISQVEENPIPFTPTQETLTNDDFISNEANHQPNKHTEGNIIDKENVNKEETQSKIDDIAIPRTIILEEPKKTAANENILKSILDELNDDEFDKPKENKFFTGGNKQVKESQKALESNEQKGQVVEVESSQMNKKRFVIESDDETERDLETEPRKKKLKKKKAEKRALQISDDEDEEECDQEEEDYLSDLEEDPDRLVEYDSEENEIEVTVDKPKKKRKVADFFEQEAELTSEDEWVGSGDEDEKGLDRMEREEGDDEVFHQGKLRRELGQIHMRDVLDQDKREVRIIQELLFEDGDLGGGSRQRKFRWRNAGDEDATGTVPDEFGDTQEEEFESEEQWRKQRHEREVFLRQMQQQDEEDSSLNVSVNRTTIIKANLSSKSMSMLLQEVNQSKVEKTDSPIVPEKKTAKDIPSPKKGFSIFQQNYHGSLLTRGRGALARLAALATPLAADDDDAPKIGSVTSHKRNFVFAALTQDDNEEQAKVTVKRKAENLGTPKLMKKMKVEEKQTRSRSSLLDHLNL